MNMIYNNKGKYPQKTKKEHTHAETEAKITIR
jgi:hypothetical protein